MARLEGGKPATWPYIVGLLVLAALAAGIYSYSRSRSTSSVDASNTAPSSAIVEATPTTDEGAGNVASGNEASGTSGDNGNAMSGVTPEGTPSDAASADATPTDATSTEATSATPSVTDDANAATDAATAGTPAPETTPSVASTPVPSGTATGAKKDVVSKRSKTITNNKNGTTVTYSKEVHSDGSTTHNKTTGATPVTP
jgi:hypothetical protein